MPSGYEQSPDYGDGAPRPPITPRGLLWVAAYICLTGFLIWLFRA